MENGYRSFRCCICHKLDITITRTSNSTNKTLGYPSSRISFIHWLILVANTKLRCLATQSPSIRSWSSAILKLVIASVILPFSSDSIDPFKIDLKSWICCSSKVASGNFSKVWALDGLDKQYIKVAMSPNSIPTNILLSNILDDTPFVYMTRRY